MAVGGQTNQQGGSGGVLGTVAQFWPALNGALERNKTLALANQEKQLDLSQRRETSADVARNFGGLDQKSGIYWDGPQEGPNGTTQTVIDRGDEASGINPVWRTNTPQPQISGLHTPGVSYAPAASPVTEQSGSPMAAVMGDPMTRMAARLDPKGVMSNIITQAFAPPSTFQVTSPTGEVRSQLLTRSQASRLQQQGYQIAESDKAKPWDPNTPPQSLTAPGNDGREHTFLRVPGSNDLRSFGGPGKFVNPAQSDIGKLLQDFQTFGGGQSLVGQKGSGAPNQGTMPQASPQGGAGVVQTPANQPAAATPVYDPVAATDRNVMRRPWLQPVTPTTANQPAAGGKVPTMADILQQKMIQAARSPEEQARLNKQAENTVAPFDFDQQERAKNAKLTQAYEGAMQGSDQTIGVIDTLLDPNNDEGLGATTGFGGTWLGKHLTQPGSGMFGRTPVVGTTKGLFPSDMDARESQLEAKSFLEGLASLKSQSATGASGLGAVSETEGNRVIQAQAALDRSQTKENYAAALDNFRQALRQAKANVRKAYEAEIGGGSSGGGWKIERVK